MTSSPCGSRTTSRWRRPTPGTEYRARAVILAMGSAYRELGLPDRKRLSGRGVSWCATCDGFFFRDQDIAVVGGGDSGRGGRLPHQVRPLGERSSTAATKARASKIMAERAHAAKISFAWNSAVDAIHGDEG